MYSTTDLPVQDRLTQDMLNELELLKPYNPALSKLYVKGSERDSAPSSTFGISDKEPEGILNQAIVALSALSKEAGAAGSGLFGGSNGPLEDKRKESLAALRSALHMHKAAAYQQRQELVRLEKELKEKNQALKDKEQLEQENVRLKDELRAVKAELDKTKAVKLATDQTMNTMSSQFASQFAQFSSHLSSVLATSTTGTSAVPSALGSILDDETPALPCVTSTDSLVTPSMPKPSTQLPQAARDDIQGIGSELVRLFKYLDPSRVFLLFVLSDIFYPESSARLASAVGSLTSATSGDSKTQTLVTCLTTYQEKVSSLPPLPDLERTALRAKIAPRIQDLYARQKNVSVSSIIQQLDALNQSHDSQPGFHRTTNVFHEKMLPAIKELQKSGNLSDAPFPSEMKELGFATKFAALYQQKVPVLPPVDSSPEFKKDFEEFKRLARPTPSASGTVSRPTATRFAAGPRKPLAGTGPGR